MAVTRISLADIETEILRIMGYASSSAAPWGSQSNLIRIVNSYMQRLPSRLVQMTQTIKDQQQRLPNTNIPRFDMWKTSGSLTCTSGSSTVHFPVDYDHYISFWDATNNRPIYPIDNVDKYHGEVKTRPAGPPEFIEIQGYVTNSTVWQRKGILWPPTMTGVTPSITINYWRLPASMPGTSPTDEYPDIDPKYEMLSVYGPVVELAMPNSQEFDRYSQLEQSLMLEIALTARATSG